METCNLFFIVRGNIKIEAAGVVRNPLAMGS
jgi:hypothetical protein